MQNQVYTGTPTSRRFALCPTTILAGDPVLIGTEPAVALDNYQSNTGGSTFLMTGSFNLSVYGRTAVSPPTSAALKPGDKVYAAGTLDTVTNVTHTLTLDGNSSNTLFGVIDPSYSAGVTSGAAPDTAAIVQIGGGA